MSIAHKFVDFPGLRYYHNRLKESIESEMEEAYAAKEDVPVVATSTELSDGSSTEPRSVTPKLIHDYVTGEVSSGVAGLVDSAPAGLDTLKELASAIGNDPSFATTVSGQIGSKLDASSSGYIKSLSIDGKTITYTRGDSTTGTLTTQDTTYTPASEAPLAPASTAVVGTSVKYAREDHVHPVQTTITGNAGTATKFASAQTVKLEGDVSGSASSQAGWTVSTELAASGVTAGSYGPSTNATPGYGATFDVPSITVDAKGRVTSASTKTVTIPASDNVDTKVAQTATGTSDTGAYPILLKNTTATDSITDGSRFVSGITVQPSTGTISATKFSGAFSGNASSATEFSSAKTVELTGDVAGSTSSKAGWSIATELSTTGVTAGSYGPSANATPGYGATFNVPYITVDAKGRVTSASTKTVKIPASDNVDTKVNVTLGTTTKAYLLGTSTTPTSTAAGVTAVSDTGVYLDTTEGRLTAGSFAGDGQNITFGSANAVMVTDASKKLVSHSSVTTTELGYLDGVTSSIQTQLNGKAASSHNQASSTINAMTGYSKPSSTSAIGTSDTLNAAIGKLEKALDGKQASGNYASASHNHDASNINSGTLDAARIPGLDASKISSGTIDIARLPAGALPILKVVGNETERFALTSSDVQVGDTVQQTDTGLMYYVKDVSKLNSADGYAVYTAGAATSVPWSGITNKPSTYAPSAHNQASSTINAMTGYSKPSSTSAIGTSDTLNVAIGKLEKALDGKQASGSYAAASHNHASSEVTAMTSYAKPSSTSAIAATDSLNAAIGKLEKALDGKAATSHGTHVTFSTDAPKAAGTASAGGSSTTTVAKSDHVHPLQTTVSGNAGTATKFASAQSVALTGDVTGSASSQAGWSIATTLADSGVTAGTYGNTTQQTPSHGGTFNIPYYTVDAKGRVTEGGTTTVKLPSDSNTDTLMTQNVSTTNSDYPLLAVATANATANLGAKTAIFGSGVKINPSTSTITATAIKGAPSGSTYVAAATEGKALLNATMTGYGGIFNAPTKTNRVALSTYPSSNEEVMLYSVTNENVTAGTNTINKSMKWDASNGRLTTSSFAGDGQNITLSVANGIVTTDANKKLVSASSIGNITSAGAIGTTANLPIITDTNGVLKAGSFGTAANTFCQGNDSRLSNARTPVAHASTATTYGVSDASNYGHAMASSTTPIVAGTAAVGSETAKFARGDHVHPEQTTVKQAKGVFLVIPNETAQTATLTATVSGITEYFPGLTIAYRAPFNTAASSTLNINSLGAKPIYYKVNTTSKDYYPANTVILLVYETTTASGGCWKMVFSYDGNNNNYDRRLHNNNVIMAAAVAANTIIVGTSAGYKQAASGITFDLAYPILVATEAKAAAAVSAKTYEALPTVNLQTTKASWTGTQYAMAFLVGTLSGNTVTIDSSVFTTTVPSTADGKIYIPIGLMASTYQIFFASSKDVYQYTNGSFHLLDTTTAATGGTNGTVKINGTEVAVKGLGSAAYTASTAYAASSHNQASSTINAMTGYSKPSSTSAIATSDTLNAAIGKLEKALDGKQASGSYAAASHNQASSTINAMTGYSKPSSTSAIGTSDTLNAAIGKLEKALDGKQASGTYLTPSSTLDATKLSGTIPSACYTDTIYTHPTTSGNKHVPSGGSSGQFLGWDSDGTAKWVANPNSNWTTHLYAGAASNATANATTATTNAATYIVVCDNSSVRNAVQVTGTNGTTVSAVNGKLTIDSVSLSAVTNAEIDAAIFA